MYSSIWRRIRQLMEANPITTPCHCPQESNQPNSGIFCLSKPDFISIIGKKSKPAVSSKGPLDPQFWHLVWSSGALSVLDKYKSFLFIFYFIFIAISNGVNTWHGFHVPETGLLWILFYFLTGGELNFMSQRCICTWGSLPRIARWSGPSICFLLLPMGNAPKFISN